MRLRYENGFERSVYLDNVLEITAFKGWRNIGQFSQESVNPEVATVAWNWGDQLDPDTLCRDLLASSGGKEFSMSGFSPAVG